jgi:Rad3-related DNA helicase
MQFSLDEKSASLSVGEFSDFSVGPREAGGGPQGLWRAQLGQHWHNELRTRTTAETPDARFEVPIEDRLVHRGWTLTLTGRIDQLVPPPGTAAKADPTLREIKTVTRPLPVDESELRADYPAYFLQLATYLVLSRVKREPRRGELVFVEASSGLAQTVVLTPFDEALVHHQLDAVVRFLDLRLRASARRRALQFQPPFAELRPGQETIQSDLAAALARSPVILFEAPTGYGKTGCALEFALERLRAGAFHRLVWLTGKSTGQIQVVRTLEAMAGPRSSHVISAKSPGAPLPIWQVRNKGEHCVNDVFHCVRDACRYLAGAEERWPQSGLAKFYLDEKQPHDLDTLRAAGRAAHICPYEITRAALAFNDVWIGDYNYVFAPANRSLFFEQPGFLPGETLLVIDEAHNLPSRVADAYSHTARDDEARALLAELDHLRAPAPLQVAVEEWARLLGTLPPAEAIDPVSEAVVLDLLERLTELTTTLPLDYAALGPNHSRTLWQFVAYHDFLTDPALKKLLWVPRAGELAFTCLDATEAIGATLRTFGGALLMSATLTPFASTASACGLVGRAAPDETALGGSELARDVQIVARMPAPTDDFTAVAPAAFSTLRAPAAWRDHAYDVAVDLRVDTSLRYRAGHLGTTAATIEATRAAADGTVAVFFPSYAYAENVLRALENSGTVLRTALQPKLPDLAAQAAWVEESLALADALFLVLGSSFAEGIDLLGGRVTHAIVVGPALPEVNAVQKARLAAFAGLGREAAFRRVYQIPGLQKVNQALGRLVRAPGQRAKVLLHCRRFAETSYASLLAPEYQLYREIANEADLDGWLAARI